MIVLQTTEYPTIAPQCGKRSGQIFSLYADTPLISSLENIAVFVTQGTLLLGYPPHDPAGHGIGNSRNGYSAKNIQSKDGEFELEVPRDRNGSFEPQVLRKASAV